MILNSLSLSLSLHFYTQISPPLLFIMATQALHIVYHSPSQLYSRSFSIPLSLSVSLLQTYSPSLPLPETLRSPFLPLTLSLSLPPSHPGPFPCLPFKSQICITEPLLDTCHTSLTFAGQILLFIGRITGVRCTFSSISSSVIVFCYLLFIYVFLSISIYLCIYLSIYLFVFLMMFFFSI